jgi:hypothetical protein
MLALNPTPIGEEPNIPYFWLFAISSGWANA